MASPRGTVYLLHFERPYKHARHYLGFAQDLERRLELHRAGRGARLVEVIAQAGIGFQLARTLGGRPPARAAAQERPQRAGAALPALPCREEHRWLNRQLRLPLQEEPLYLRAMW
jgi:hypothetical protein